ncbi:MAG: hypothetical protein ACXW3M_14480, partial [Rhodoplanes sp.]
MNAAARKRAPALALHALAGALFLTPLNGNAAERLDANKALARSEAAIGRVIGAYTLTEASGAPLALRA